MNTQAYVKNAPHSTSETVKVQIGDICCAIAASDAEVVDGLRVLFDDFMSDSPPDFVMEFVDVDQPETREPSGGATHHIVLPLKDIKYADTDVTEERNPAALCLKVDQLNRLMCLAYYSACKAKHDGNPRQFLVHCCGIVRYGQALLFAAPSGGGKTTVARLCGKGEGELINDETLLVSRPDPCDGITTVQGPPIVSIFSPQKRRTAPVRCLMLLEKSPQASVRPLSPGEAYSRFMHQVITPSYIGQTDRREALSLMADFAGEIIGAVPAYELSFSLDATSLWKAVSELELSLEKEKRQ